MNSFVEIMVIAGIVYVIMQAFIIGVDVWLCIEGNKDK